MIRFGYAISSEETSPRDAVEHTRAAEDGFDFLSVSDHFHPWVRAQGHSPFVWSLLGAISQATSHIDVGTGVTCPMIRTHPAVIAQATATTSLLLGDRFFFGVGTGEALNEHITGAQWPRHEIRLRMFEESIDVIRQLWTGETVNHEGEFFNVDNAKLFDAPHDRIPVIVSAFGPDAAEVAARIGDGFVGHEPHLKMFKDAGGTGPTFSQISMCWAESAEEARKTVHQTWPNGGLSGQLSQDLPTWMHFEDASESVDEKAATKDTPCGPDVEPIVKMAKHAIDAGFDRVYFHQIGPDQRGFFDFWQTRLRPALKEIAA